MQAIKVVEGQLQDGTPVKYKIFINQTVGRGSFGEVKKAYNTLKPQKELVSKIIPFSTQKKRNEIEKQLKVLQKIPITQNIVKVQPIKCFSKSNCYIFMEYCKDGTLQNKIAQKNCSFSEDQILDFFYQFMNGYKVLYEAKILHQDIKPENILLKKNTYKITDFGFSIFMENYKYGESREGTLRYIPLQKLTQPEYYANTKSDVFALGVILFRMTIGHFPYVQKAKDVKDYIKQLKESSLKLQASHYHKFSIKFQYFLDIIVKMVAKYEKNRIDFQQLFQYIEKEQLFQKYKKRVVEPTQEIELDESQQNIIGYSNVLTIPFGLNEYEEQIAKEKSYVTLQEKKEKLQMQTNQKIATYIINRRIIIYFFNRLARRLDIEKLTKAYITQEKLIFGLILLCRRIIKQIFTQIKIPSIFNHIDWATYRKEKENYILLIERDDNYLQSEQIDLLGITKQLSIKQKKQVLDYSSKQLDLFQKYLKSLIEQNIKQRTSLISHNITKAEFVTLHYLISSLKILENFQQWAKNATKLEKYIRQIQMEGNQNLETWILQELAQRDIQFALVITQ